MNTPRAILGAANAVVWKWDSDAFGTTAANENPSALGTFNYNLRFPGQYYDKETANHYNYFRDNYNPKIGRYMQSDPIGLRGGLNTYTYTFGNPIFYKDPTGLDVWTEGPSGNEPSFHQSVNVGNPIGTYDSYSFGMNGKGLQGEVYQDVEHGGVIDAYKKTTIQQDSEFKKLLDNQLGNKGIYGYDDICRSWSQRQFKNAPGVPITPPVRLTVPQFNISPSSSRSTTGTSSTTGTGTSR